MFGGIEYLVRPFYVDCGILFFPLPISANDKTHMDNQTDRQADTQPAR